MEHGKFELVKAIPNRLSIIALKRNYVIPN